MHWTIQEKHGNNVFEVEHSKGAHSAVVQVDILDNGYLTANRFFSELDAAMDHAEELVLATLEGDDLIVNNRKELRLLANERNTKNAAERARSE